MEILNAKEIKKVSATFRRSLFYVKETKGAIRFRSLVTDMKVGRGIHEIDGGGEKFGISEERFDHLIEWLASKYSMTSSNYKIYVRAIYGEYN